MSALGIRGPFAMDLARYERAAVTRSAINSLAPMFLQMNTMPRPRPATPWLSADRQERRPQ